MKYHGRQACNLDDVSSHDDDRPRLLCDEAKDALNCLEGELSDEADALRRLEDRLRYVMTDPTPTIGPCASICRPPSSPLVARVRDLCDVVADNRAQISEILARLTV